MFTAAAAGKDVVIRAVGGSTASRMVLAPTEISVVTDFDFLGWRFYFVTIIFMAMAVGKEVDARDGQWFHHLKDGSCSCRIDC